VGTAGTKRAESERTESHEFKDNKLRSYIRLKGYYWPKGSDHATSRRKAMRLQKPKNYMLNAIGYPAAGQELKGLASAKCGYRPIA
jgi:hypothetical protein